MMPTRCFNDADVEWLAHRLASQIREELGSTLDQAQFLAVPRGGFFILGLLAYLLDLKPEQLPGSVLQAPSLVVVVDDCALSGSRLAATLASASSSPSRFVAAVLAAPAPLQAAAVRAEPRLQALLAAEEIAVESETTDAEPHRDRLAGRRYWLGRCQPIAFPWSEPERVFFVDSEKGIDEGWRSLSPLATLRGRAESGLQLNGSQTPAFRLPDGVLWRWDGDGVLFWREDTDRLHRLDRIGRAMWLRLISEPDLVSAATRLSDEYEVEKFTLQNDLESLSQQLIDSGLLLNST